MADLIPALQSALRDAVRPLLPEPADADALEVPVLRVPDDKPGDYGSPIAFGLAKRLRRNPAQIAAELAAAVVPPEGVARVEAVGPYLNAYVDPGAFVRAVVRAPLDLPPSGRKVVIEHTSVNPNKEAHVGHLRNIVLGDAVARIERAAGHRVEVQNYIDDTGRQAAESLFAVRYFDETPPADEKYDHWLGRLYVRLGEAKERDPDTIERGVAEVMHRLERGELRHEVERIVRAQLATYHALGAEYDLLVWESDVVAAGFLQRGLEVLERLPHVTRPTEGKFAGALVMDVSEFLPGLEEPQVVLVRSGGNAMYVAKDIGYHLWKVGRLAGMAYRAFDRQPSGHTLWTTHPDGAAEIEGHDFGHAQQAVNVIDVRQAHPQAIVRAALELTRAASDDASVATNDGAGEAVLHHLAYEVVTLEGQAMSGRKGVTLAIDAVLEEAVRRARAVVADKQPDLPAIDDVARAVGVGALRFAMLKSEAKRVIDFRWEQALSLAGDSAPYVQYAHARADSILRAAAEAAAPAAEAAAPAAPDAAADDRATDWDALGPLEVKLAQLIARYPEVVRNAAHDDAPHVVAQYALDLATAWNGYYNHRGPDGRPDTAVLRAEPGLREARLALVAKVRDTLARALGLLGVEAPRQM
ncbi:MAG: arginine--tRNA ligase [Trueperaceae bacterium]|nr:arginine--tRNA ligase [Trueperaceae bacterium]